MPTNKLTFVGINISRDYAAGTLCFGAGKL